MRGDAVAVGAELTSARAGVRTAIEETRRATAVSRERRRRSDAVRRATGSRLTGVLERAARGLLERDDEETLEHTLRLIVQGAIVALGEAAHAGITLVGPDGTIASHAPSDALVADLDALQNRLGEGPCRDAVHVHTAVTSHDLAADQHRWPRFVAAVRERGIGSMLSFPLLGRGTSNTGALNIYADGAGVFDESAVEAGTLFASHAALALHGARRTEQLNDALRSRDVIGQANPTGDTAVGEDDATPRGHRGHGAPQRVRR